MLQDGLLAQDGLTGVAYIASDTGFTRRVCAEHRGTKGRNLNNMVDYMVYTGGCAGYKGPD